MLPLLVALSTCRYSRMNLRTLQPVCQQTDNHYIALGLFSTSVKGSDHQRSLQYARKKSVTLEMRNAILITTFSKDQSRNPIPLALRIAIAD